jgi:SAM-dependent methyltransferase
LAWRRGRPPLENEPKETLFSEVEGNARHALLQREQDLRARYHLESLQQQSTLGIYRENLYILDILDSASDFLEGMPPELRALDVGSKDFRYAFALDRWLSRGRSERPRSVDLTGIELDGHPIYRNLYSRADYAEAYAHATGNPNVRYAVADFLHFDGQPVDVVFFFFPFVLRYALVRWGLPLGHFKPEQLFEKALTLLNPGGLLVIMNHTFEERARQLEILRALEGVEVLQSQPASSAMVDYADSLGERSLTIARKGPSRS